MCNIRLKNSYLIYKGGHTYGGRRNRGAVLGARRAGADRDRRKIADNILHSAHDAEECENDTWLAAWNSMPDNRPARLAPYLGRITRNLALDRFDKASAQKRGSGQTCAPLDELAECVAAPGGVEDSFDAAETGRIISDFLRTLPEETRNIFLRRYWYCDATADIAARYGLTESKVRVTLHRTRGKLAAYLQERGAAL